MLAILGKILGSEKVISKGMDLIDDMVVTSEEEIAAKSKAKIDLMNAYAPFKLAQRYRADVCWNVSVHHGKWCNRRLIRCDRYGERRGGQGLRIRYVAR